jgi:hypothetical protein
MEDTHSHPDDCATTNSFADHGVDDGTALVTATYRRLAGPDGPAYAPTADFFDRLEEAFLWAYLGSVEEPGVPPHVEAAVADARALTHAEFADAPDADLRTDVVPAFYQRVASFHCTYR